MLTHCFETITNLCSYFWKYRATEELFIIEEKAKGDTIKYACHVSFTDVSILELDERKLPSIKKLC
jgi:hypothetical protein